MDNKANIEFSRPIREEEGKTFSAWREIEDKSADLKELSDTERKEGWKLYELTENDQEALRSILFHIKDRLKELGLNEPQITLPSEADFVFITNADLPYTTGAHGYALVRIFLRHGAELNDEDARAVIFHEAAHYVTKKIYGAAKTDSSIGLKIIGNDKVSAGEGYKGIYEEPAADLFAAYCLNEDEESEEIYAIQTPFFIAMLNAFSKSKGIVPFEAFVKFFTAKANGDFSFQRELKEAFGADLVKRMNNFERYRVGEIEHCNQMEELGDIAKEGNFHKDFVDLLTKLEKGEPIAFPGLRGKMKSSDQNLISKTLRWITEYHES